MREGLLRLGLCWKTSRPLNSLHVRYNRKMSSKTSSFMIEKYVNANMYVKLDILFFKVLAYPAHSSLIRIKPDYDY